MTIETYELPASAFAVDPNSWILYPYGAGPTICKVDIIKGLWITQFVANVPEHGEGYVCADSDKPPKNANDPIEQNGQLDDAYWSATGAYPPTGKRTWTVPGAREDKIRRPTVGPYYLAGTWYASSWTGFSNFGGVITYDLEKSTPCARIAVGKPQVGDRVRCFFAGWPRPWKKSALG